MAVHVRHQNPPQYRRYRSYKRWLRIEFSYACVFCNLWEREVGGSDKFAVEHYLPKKQFPHLTTVYTNLLYACPRCNSHKNEYWPTPRQLSSGKFVLNVCVHDIDVHIDKSAPAWIGLTPEGRWNIWKFRLANRAKVAYRRDREISQELLDEVRTQLRKAQHVLRLARQQKNAQVVIQISRTVHKLTEERELHKRRLKAKRDPD